MKFLSLLILLTMLTSCGESPLWNHQMEKNGLVGRVVNNTSVETNGHHFAKSKFSFSLEWITGPIKGESKLILRSWSNEVGSINGPFQDLPEKFHVFIWMPDMGHGSSPVKINKIDEGEYEISAIYFIMGGRWDIYFQLLKNDKVVDEVVLPIIL